MSDHPNVATVGRAFAAWNSGQIETLKEIFSADVVLHLADTNRLSGTYRGADAVADALLRAQQGGAVQADVEAILASDAHVMVFFHATGARGGTRLDVVEVLALKVDAAGKFTEVWGLANDQAAHDAFYAALP